jgi:O-antigen ligase
MTIPLIAFFVAGNRFVRGASFVISAGSALAVVLTFSRGAWLAFPIGLAACGIMALRRQMIHRTAVFGGVILCTGIAVALLFLAKPIYQRLTFGDNGATAARLRMAVLATDLFEAYPIIGVGPGEFVEAALRLYPPGFSQNQWVAMGERQVSTSVGRVEFMELRSRGIVFFRRPLPVHNKYLLMLSELGLPGLLIWLWLYVEVIRVAWRCSKLPDRFLSLFGIAGLGVTAAELVYMMVEHFHDDKPLEPTLLIPAMLFATWRVASAEQRLSQPYGVAWRSVGQAASGR